MTDQRTRGDADAALARMKRHHSGEMYDCANCYWGNDSVCDDAALIERLEAAEERAALAEAHDRQPYPTAEAYEQVCRVLDERTAERDNLAETRRVVVEEFNALAARTRAAEADRDRLRDALERTQKALSIASVLPSVEPVRRIVAAALAGTPEFPVPLTSEGNAKPAQNPGGTPEPNSPTVTTRTPGQAGTQMTAALSVDPDQQGT